MDVVGTLELSWAQGYDGSKATYIDKDVICFVCGNNIKFVAEDGRETVFPFPGEGMGPFAVHVIHRNFAVASQGLDPKIYVYAYPTFRHISTLEGGAMLEFSHIVFSHSDYMVSVSGLPDFELCLWHYESGQKLSGVSLSHMSPTSVSFNPANWRQMCVTTETQINVWEIERCDNLYRFIQHNVRVLAEDPYAIEEEERDERIPTRASTRMTGYTVDVPKPAKAGLVGSIAERLNEIQDETVRVIPVSQAWAPNGDLYIGCKKGQLILVEGDLWKPQMMYNPAAQLGNLDSREPSFISIKSHVSFSQEDFGKMLFEGSVDCMELHRRGLYVTGADGVIRLVDVNSDEFRILEHCSVGVPITSLGFTPSYNRMMLGSSRGSVHLYEPGTPESLREHFDLHHGKFVGIGLLAPGSEYVVTLREDGELQLWDIETGRLAAAMPVGIQCSSLTCSPLCHCVAVGTASGHLYIVDCNNLENIRIIHRAKIHSDPILHLHFDQLGNFLLSASNDGNIFLIDGRASEKFSIIGHTDVKGEIQAVSTYTEPKTGAVKVVVTSNATAKKLLGATNLMVFDISEEHKKDMNVAIGSLKCELKADVINKLEYFFKTPTCGVAVTGGGVVYSIGQNNKNILKFVLPEEIPDKGDKGAWFLEPSEELPGHQLPGGKVVLSPHQKWLASCGTDGKVSIRSVLNMEKTVDIKPHDYVNRGVGAVIYSDDGTKLVSLGKDGMLTCYNWQFSAQGVSRAKSALESSRARKSRMLQRQQDQDMVLQEMADWTPTPPSSRPSSTIIGKEDKELSEKEETQLSDEIYTTPTPVPGADATWLECKELEAHKEEDKQYTEVKKNLRVQIRDMRRTIQTMMRTNETLPDIEKLGRHEFDLDIEEQIRLQNEGEAEVQRIREEFEFENLAKMFLREKIKKECWDDMQVKGRAILAFNSYLEVSNFPMKSRSKKTLSQLETVVKRRKTEMMDAEARKELSEAGRKPNSPLEDETGELEDVEDESKERPSTTGSLGAQYGGGSDLLYSQFDLHNREQKSSQIVLLEDAIYRIKLAFNKEFEEVFAKKEQEISKIREKNKRIKKILDDLDLIEEVLQPEMTIAEKPEMMLTVEDHEVKVEKFLTAEQRKKVEEEVKVEEERRQREKGDNARERALGMMMGGVLEIKKEDELKKDIAMPAFMNKPQEEWSEDEQKAAKDFDRRVKELLEEREKYRKQLETELRKLQAFIQESMQAFDEALNQLFMRKVKTQMVIYQEELKMIRLRFSLLMEEELEVSESELNRLLEHKRSLKQKSVQSVTEFRQQVDAYREQYDIVVAEDKVMEKAFKREFSDCTALQVEHLFKLFKKRPRGQKLKGDTPILDPSTPNPFTERPSTARKDGQAKVAMDAFLEEADKEINIPEGVDEFIWERLCKYRKDKVESEQLVKSKVNTLAAMNAFYQARQEEDDMLKNDIDDVIKELTRLKEHQQRFTCNLEVQLMLKQGQVEIDAGSFIHDFKESVLIHRNVVEDLNRNIKQLGESKIASMVESKDFRKGIIQLEWEHKRMMMLLEDFNSKMKDIQFMKVTREIQMFLNEADYDAKKSQEVGILEQTILLLQKHHEKNVRAKKRMMKELNSTVKQKQDENKHIDGELGELNVSVNERLHIDQVNAERRLDTGADKRYQEIVQRRKLVDLAKAQAQEVAVLRAEVERLRMRTFPALVQVER